MIWNKYSVLLPLALMFLILACNRSGSEVIRIDNPPENGVFSLQNTILKISQINFDSASYIDDIGYQRIDFEKLKTLKQKTAIKEYKAIEIENKFIKLTLIPDRGKPYSFIYKVTGNEEFFIPEIAQIQGSPNKTGWWFLMGGAEYNMPDEEHGETWAVPWSWEVIENSPRKKSVMMSVNELRYGLKESVTISVYPDKAFYEAHISITNPTDSTIKFQHWINPMWVPGGDRNGLTPNTEFIIPTKDVYVTERTFNNWMLSYSPDSNRLQPWEENPMRFFRNWKNSGDLLAWKVEKGFYSAFSHEKSEGIVRVFPVDINPGCNIWTFGFEPEIRRRVNFSGSETHNGYVEMWGGITQGFNNYYSLGPGETLSWTEWMYPYLNTGGLHYADQDFAATFFDKENNNYEVSLCPSGDVKGLELKVISSGTHKSYLFIVLRSAFPKKSIKGFSFISDKEDLELIISRRGEEIIRLKPRKTAF